ncbi:MAG TPA: delta-60 repeat domain-containing protein, partial [Pyrinomonadaceae bacterium]|nr:delta-60 repeat domain-containing protein [Pyrinomonadaceae bacterium]
MDKEPYDQPGEAAEFYRLKRSPAGEDQVPVVRYLTAPDQIKEMLQYSSSLNQVLPSQEMRGQVSTDVLASSPSGLDLTFGVDGTVQVDLGYSLDDSATAVAFQPDGKVVVVGYVTTVSSGRDFSVIRLNSNGTLDTSFAGSGKLTFNFNSASRDDIARAVSIQPDGKILIAGESDSGLGNVDIALARLNTDGSFDFAFGNSGKVLTDLPGNRADFGRAVRLQLDGKIIVAGYSNRATSGDDFVVVRYTATGSLDGSFNGSGFVTTDVLVNREDRGAAVALQTDGKIVAAGYTSDPSLKNNFAVVRYNSNGSLDTTFNGSGKATLDLNLNSDDFANALAVQGDGRIIVAGQTGPDFGVVRYNSNGTPDSTFGIGGNGIVITKFASGATSIGRGIAIDSTGKIIVAGRSRTELAIAKYKTDGTLDTSFGSAGLVVQNAGNNFISGFGGYWGIALQADDKIVAAGDGWRDGFRNDFTVSRLNANGTFDSSFGGGDGMATTDFNFKADNALSVALQTDGKIIVGGSAQNAGGGNDFALARYNTDGTLDTVFGSNGKVMTDILNHPNDHGVSVALQPDGRILLAGYTNDQADGNVDDAVLIRYNSNGSLDATFGSGGITILTGTYVTNGGLAWLRHRSIALQTDGKIVVAGEA